ncbi:caspase-14 [Amia ocellicauda]|uniref:caspase-14 n=1 Tax=Amia ocellicauda TaxID=2972642 RepID=UPI0034646EE8
MATHIDERKWLQALANIVEELEEVEYKKMQNNLLNIPGGKRKSTGKTDMPQLIISTYGLEHSVKEVARIMKLIPRNDPTILNLLQPFMSKIKTAAAPPVSSTASDDTPHPAQGDGPGFSCLKRQKTVDRYNDEGDVYDINGTRDVFVLCQKVDRPGAKRDLQIVNDLMEKRYSFNLKIKEDLDGKEIVPEIRTFRDGLSKDVKCCFVVLMAHGTMKDGKALIVGVDKNLVPLSEIFSLFNNHNCPQLQGKPKVFIIQACRGSNRDSSVMQADDEAMETAYEEDSPFKFSLPIISDTLAVYPTLPGYKALRHPFNGSPLILNMEKVFKQFDDRYHVLDLFTKVNRILVHQDYI